MKIAVISSSGGSAFAAFYDIAKDFWPENKYFIITDRPCGIEQIAIDNQLPHIRFEEKDNNLFSEKSANWLSSQGGVDLCFLFFTRLISSPLFSSIPCVNFHESLLPSFCGFHALSKALSMGVKFFGATAHLVDKDIDHGVIIAQASAPLLSSATLDEMNRVSFIQKIYLQLVVSEALNNHQLILTSDKIIWSELPSVGIQFNPLLKNSQLKEPVKKLIVKNNVSPFFNTQCL